MTTMIDTNGKEHQITAPGNVPTLQSIGWTVKADPVYRSAVPAVTPQTEREWDAVFGRR